MLAKRREQIIVVLGLLSVNVLLAWTLNRLWKDYRSHTRWLYAGTVAQEPVAPSGGSAKAGPPQSFVQIVDRNLFSPLRGSKPPQADEAVKTPPLPLLFGTMDLGEGRFALMAPVTQGPPVSKRVMPGEEIGEWKLVSVDTATVVVEWRDTKTTLEITEPSRRSGTFEKTAGPAVRPAPVTAVGSGAGSYGAARTSGVPAGSPAAAASPPDVPVGAIVGGKRKVIVQSPFGPKIGWEDVGAQGPASPNQTGGPNK